MILTIKRSCCESCDETSKYSITSLWNNKKHIFCDNVKCTKYKSQAKEMQSKNRKKREITLANMEKGIDVGKLYDAILKEDINLSQMAAYVNVTTSKLTRYMYEIELFPIELYQKAVNFLGNYAKFNSIKI